MGSYLTTEVDFWEGLISSIGFLWPQVSLLQIIYKDVKVDDFLNCFKGILKGNIMTLLFRQFLAFPNSSCCPLLLLICRFLLSTPHFLTTFMSGMAVLPFTKPSVVLNTWRNAWSPPHCEHDFVDRCWLKSYLINISSLFDLYLKSPSINMSNKILVLYSGLVVISNNNDVIMTSLTLK